MAYSNLISLFFALVIAALPSHAAIADESLEYKVKAAFLYKFSAYVDWPATAFDSPTSPFTVCLVDSSALFNAALGKVVNGESVNGHPVVVRQIDTAEKVGCHILYIGTSNPQRITQAIKAVDDGHTLTVCDSVSQGIIDFLITDNRVRFNIDDEAATQKGLVISSKLLNLALNVKKRPLEKKR